MALMPALLPKYDAPDDRPFGGTEYESSVIHWTEAAYDEAELDQQQSEEIREVQNFIDYLDGKQWTASRPSYKSKPIDNEMIGLFWEIVGQLTDIRPVIEIRSSWTEQTDATKRDVDVLNNGIRAWSLETDFDLKLAMCVAYAILTTAYAKFQWNPELNDCEGELEMVPLGPDQVMPLKPKNGDLETAACVVYREVLPLTWFKLHYPGMGAAVRPDDRYSRFSISPGTPANVNPLVFKNMQEGLRRKIAGSPQMRSSAIPMAEYREFWIKDETRNTSNANVVVGDPTKNWSYTVAPNERLYPRKRLICMGGRTILWDSPNPYWHGRYPFAMLRLNIVPWSFYGKSDLKSQVPMQDIINNILAGVLDLLKKALNPPFYAPKNAFSPDVWEKLDFSMPNARAAYNQNSTHEPKFLTIPPVPGTAIPLLQMIRQQMKESSTGSLASELAKKKQLPAMEGIDALKSEKQTPVRLKGRNIESFLKVGGQMMVSNIVQFWDAKKRMAVLGTKGLTFEDFDWDLGTMVPHGESREKFAKRFKFYIQPGSLLSIKRMEERLEALTLWKLKAISIEGLYRSLDGRYDVNKIKQEMIENAKTMAALTPPKGSGGGHKTA